jgi:inhibitor of KinA sporulation pathway (predicted exonuclease)
MEEGTQMNYIIFDLEATCWENDKSKTSEIIEIGAVKLNDRLEVVNTFSKFIKPVIYPVLSDFCIRLTSIEQKDVDTADIFKNVIVEFENWITSSDTEVALCSWGFYDKKQIYKECKVKNYSGRIHSLLDKHISIKHQFAEIKGISPCGMSRGLDLLGLPLEGIHHRGIDDAKNITKIFVAVFDKLKMS